MHGREVSSADYARAVSPARKSIQPLSRFDPHMRRRGMNPFRLDSPRSPDEARHMLAQAQLELEEKYRIYEDLAARDGSRFHPHWEEA